MIEPGGEIPTGLRGVRTVSVGMLASGFPLSVPVLVIQGAQERPRIGFTATIHGDEVVGVQILRELWKCIDPRELRGTLWLMPVANPLALESLSRNTPLDMLDLNRVFPGVQDGWFSEQLAWAITEQFLSVLDCYIDLHAGGTFPIVDYCYVLNDQGLSRAFLSQLLYKPSQIYPGTTASVTTAKNVPTAVVELGGGYLGQEEHVARGLRGVRNMLMHLGVLPGTPEQTPKQLLLQEIKVMRPRNGGLCIPNRSWTPGTHLKRGCPLAEIISPYTFESLEVLTAPFEDNVVVLARNYTTRINPGDYAFMMGDVSTAEYL